MEKPDVPDTAGFRVSGFVPVLVTSTTVCVSERPTTFSPKSNDVLLKVAFVVGDTALTM
jgi:hypothetical protein